MEKSVVLNVLKRIENLLYYDESVAKEYVRVEIENLENITPNKCKFISQPSHCYECYNLNCSNNKKKQ